MTALRSEGDSGSIDRMRRVLWAISTASGIAFGRKKPPDPAPAASDAGLVDLLWSTPSVVAVSSRVRNPRDLPTHLVDHKPETAWNSRTGDLVGGWIRFRVPKESHVSPLLLTVGFDKVAKSGEDLFAANYRIRAVRVSREGKVLRDVELDPSRRASSTVARSRRTSSWGASTKTTPPRLHLRRPWAPAVAS